GTWRAANAALLWHTFWLEPTDGMRLLQRTFPPAAVLLGSYAQLLVDSARFFRPHCTPEQQALIDGFEIAIAAPDHAGPGPARSEAAFSALLAGDDSPYVH